MKKYNIQFPRIKTGHLGQDEAFFYLQHNNKKEKILFHDYENIYKNQGLYEQLFYERLKCVSPKKVTDALKHVIDVNKDNFSEMRVLDFGAGNGMMGEEIKKTGVSRLVGVDIIGEAKIAADRDRPGTYDEYYVMDFTRLTNEDREAIRSWNLNTLTTVAALGFGDIPPLAFLEALNLINKEGWIAFNIKETFLSNADASGFSKLIKELLFSEYLYINHLERYRHRLSIEGVPLYYFSIICWKNTDVPDSFIKQYIA